jgi:hypothetical protein
VESIIRYRKFDPMWGHHKKRGLRNWVLLVLRRGPRTGAQIIEEMEVMTQGWWRPSPGSIYPMLESMVGERTLRRRPDGSYELSQSALRDSSWPWVTSPRNPKEVVHELSGLVSYLEDLARANPSSCQEVASDVATIARRLQTLPK